MESIKYGTEGRDDIRDNDVIIYQRSHPFRNFNIDWNTNGFESSLLDLWRTIDIHHIHYTIIHLWKLILDDIEIRWFIDIKFDNLDLIKHIDLLLGK